MRVSLQQEVVKHMQNTEKYDLRPKHLTERESKAFFAIKAFAILSVIAAHACERIVDAGTFADLASALLFVFTRVGVVAFFIVSGFFYRREAGDSLPFWKKKALGLVLPWVICATLTFIVSRIGDGNIPYYKWIIGHGTWYYYITVLLVFYAVFKLLARSRLALLACVALTVVSLSLEMVSLNPIPHFCKLRI